MKITIIDYGVGNLKSVQKAFEFLGYSAKISNQKEEIKTADLVVLPGVGAFAQAMKQLHELDLIEELKKYIQSDQPFLGICLGFQLLFEYSVEHGKHQGLGILKGSVQAFENKIPADLKIPHMGWNQLNIVKNTPLTKGLPAKPYVYFVHSYYVDTPDESIIFSKTDYGIPFVSAIQKENLFATQFHPEKSGEVGLQLLKNYLEEFLS